MRYTLSNFKQAFSWVAFLNMGPTDPRWLLLLNEALSRLMNLGLWVGTYQRYQICTNNACLTWPRQFETIEVVDVCGVPITVRNQWFEFLDQGPGLWRGGRGGRCGLTCPTINYLDRGRGFVTFDDPTDYCYIRLFTQFAADAGKNVNLRGWDLNQQWVLTNDGAVVGENLTLTATYIDSTTVWMPQVFREAIKDKTLGHVRAYWYSSSDPYVTGLNPDGSPHAINLAMVTLYPIALWEPGELVPDYRRCVIPSISRNAGCCSGLVPNDCKPTVTVMAKLAFVPLDNDLDLLPLTNAAAVKMAMLSVLKQERGDLEGARAAMWGNLNPITKQFEDGAVPLLENELATFQGSGSVAPIRLERGVDNAGVLNLI